ncbi:hypothetical protein DYB30_010320 [Aphanomyces astaci]|uniref:Uncharacterized protein n=1 Tax=Aphanomyces astaci TaxID=112090 RepID=A0A397DFW6_APHAT|nr:hypothetical protein DYB30_010320 [Aphanomyces astaci]
MNMSSEYIANAVAAESAMDVPEALIQYAQAIAAINSNLATCKDPVQRRQLQEAATTCQQHLQALARSQGTRRDVAQPQHRNSDLKDMDMLRTAMGASTTARRELARATGQLVAASYDKAKAANERYHMTDKVKAGVVKATVTAKHLNDTYHIQAKATSLARGGLGRLSSFNEKHHVTDRVAKSTLSGLQGLTKALGSPSKSSHEPH